MPLSLPYIGVLLAGARNSISDVAGVTVGRAMIAGGDIQIGVTVVRPHAGDPFIDEVSAASVVLNGFGKSIDPVQVDELGVLETPIALTSTLTVGAMAQAQIRQAVVVNPQIDRAWLTVSPPVFECNDGYLNDPQASAVQEMHYDMAYAVAAQVFEQGTVGAGHGMSSFGVKDDIGSTSRVVTLADDTQRTVGSLVLSSFGVAKNPTLGRRNVGAELVSALAATTPESEKGSIIMPVAIDAPLDVRQLRRLALRAGVGLTRTDSVFGHGNGDTALALPTVYAVPHEGTHAMPAVSMTHESHFGPLFRMVVDSVEQAIVHVLLRAIVVTSRDGNTHHALTELL